jgi:hypothetical protein
MHRDLKHTNKNDPGATTPSSLALVLTDQAVPLPPLLGYSPNEDKRLFFKKVSGIYK